jgi:hypothetical protein
MAATSLESYGRHYNIAQAELRMSGYGAKDTIDTGTGWIKTVHP